MAPQTVIDDDMTTQLLATARLCGDEPDSRFVERLSARRRRETAYHVEASCDRMAIRLRVSGSGMMTASVHMPCVCLAGGRVDAHDGYQVLSWADTGEEADLSTHLGLEHLGQGVDARRVIGAFLAAIGIHTNAVGSGGYGMWRRSMQMLTDRIARERGVAIEVVASPPVPGGVGSTSVEICDMRDPDAPAPIDGWQEEFREIDQAMCPEGAELTLLAPGFVLRRQLREIFHAPRG